MSQVSHSMLRPSVSAAWRGRDGPQRLCPPNVRKERDELARVGDSLHLGKYGHAGSEEEVEEEL